MKALLPVLLIALLSACDESSSTTAASAAASCGVYAIGPNQIKDILKSPEASEQAKPAPGRIAKSAMPAEVQAEFPDGLLDAQGYYRGMAVYCTVEEARKAIVEQKYTDWSVYELATDWASNVYKADDGAHHLSKDATIAKAVE
ncbi:DVU_2496 family lipoprotein [Deefgea rivuli]|uniref:DVU_2496 family lipoprotein n=1 Tax=Deefgea rivuli TaxID=400948 RepID=UPI000480F107|nr:DVU_2496 family lipoprotein [Deefgea rivuli]